MPSFWSNPNLPSPKRMALALAEDQDEQAQSEAVRGEPRQPTPFDQANQEREAEVAGEGRSSEPENQRACSNRIIRSVQTKQKGSENRGDRE